MSLCAIVDHGRQKPVTYEEFDEIVASVNALLLSGVTNFCGCGNGTVVNKCLKLLHRIKKRGFTKLKIKRCELSQKEIDLYMENSYRFPDSPSPQDKMEFTEKMWVNVADYLIVGKNRGYKIIDTDLKKLLKSREKFIMVIGETKQ